MKNRDFIYIVFTVQIDVEVFPPSHLYALNVNRVFVGIIHHYYFSGCAHRGEHRNKQQRVVRECQLQGSII